MPSETQMFTPNEIRIAAAIDKNVYDEDIKVSAKWVQDETVEHALGTKLFNRMIELILSNQIEQTQYEHYKYILHTYILYIIGWGVRADVQPQLHNKVRNAGVMRSTDEHIIAVDQETMYKNIGRYEKRRDAYVKKLIDYLCCHASWFPEYAPCSCDCDGISAARNNGYIAGIYLDDYDLRRHH